MNNMAVKASEMFMQENNLTYQEISKLSDVSVELTIIIEKLINDLEKYRQGAKANEFYIKKQSKLISDLINVTDLIKYYKFHDYLITANEQMLFYLKKDPNLKGFNVSFILDKSKIHMATIDVNIYG